MNATVDGCVCVCVCLVTLETCKTHALLLIMVRTFPFTDCAVR